MREGARGSGMKTSLLAQREGRLFAESERRCTALTDGNLSRHLDVLRNAGLMKSGKASNASDRRHSAA